jgi:hypothetical protein
MRTVHEKIAAELAHEWRTLLPTWQAAIISGNMPDFATDIQRIIRIKAVQTKKAAASLRIFFKEYYQLTPEEFCTQLTGVEIKGRFAIAIEQSKNRIMSAMSSGLVSAMDYFPPTSSNMMPRIVAIDPYSKQEVVRLPTQRWSEAPSPVPYAYTKYESPQEKAWKQLKNMAEEARNESQKENELS